MIRSILLALGIGCALATAQTPAQSAERLAKWKDKSMYDIPMKSLDGAVMDLAQFKGKVVLIVNVASKCGYTPQYAALQKLYDEMKSNGVVVLGVPSNDFGAQEPGTPQSIESFCSKNYGVTFPLTEKLQTKEGPGQSPLYEFLAARTGKLPAWNFSKFVIGKDGQPIEFFASAVKPESEELRKCIDRALAVAK